MRSPGAPETTVALGLGRSPLDSCFPTQTRSWRQHLLRYAKETSNHRTDSTPPRSIQLDISICVTNRNHISCPGPATRNPILVLSESSTKHDTDFNNIVNIGKMQIF